MKKAGEREEAEEAFSNVWHINPFSEGDFPDDARYVRLFPGLKGTGAMWADNVDFRHSKWNFTILVRLCPDSSSVATAITGMEKTNWSDRNYLQSGFLRIRQWMFLVP